MKFKSLNSPLAAARDRQARVVAFLESRADLAMTSQELAEELWKYGTPGQIRSAVEILAREGRIRVTGRAAEKCRPNRYAALVSERKVG